MILMGSETIERLRKAQEQAADGIRDAFSAGQTDIADRALVITATSENPTRSMAELISQYASASVIARLQAGAREQEKP